MSWGIRYWPIFLIISAIYIVLAFGVPETIALMSHPGQGVDNTLSHYARTELGVSVAIQSTVHTVAWWCSFVVWSVFAIWITDHIWFMQFG